MERSRKWPSYQVCGKHLLTEDPSAIYSHPPEVFLHFDCLSRVIACEMLIWPMIIPFISISASRGVHTVDGYGQVSARKI